MINTSARPQNRSRLKWRAGTAKVRRVAEVVIDQHVSCSRCSSQMHLAENLTFQCKCCGWEVAAEDAIKVLEAPSNNFSSAMGRSRN